MIVTSTWHASKRSINKLFPYSDDHIKVTTITQEARTRPTGDPESTFHGAFTPAAWQSAPGRGSKNLHLLTPFTQETGQRTPALPGSGRRQGNTRIKKGWEALANA